MSGTRTRRAGPFAAATVVALAAALAGLADAGTGSPELISRGPGEGPAGNGASAFPWVSGDGRLVAFRSEATNLVPDDTDAERDIYVRDRGSGAVVLASRASGANGVKGNRASFNPRLSPDGRYVVFRSNASNLVPEDTDRLEDIYVRDLETNETSLVSRASGPAGAKGTAISEFPIISGDGSRVAFRSESPNLHPDDPDALEDIFLRDLSSNETVLISRAAGAGPKGNGRSTFVALSEDGDTVAFDSVSTNLHPDDTDPAADVFARDISSGALELISRSDGETG